MKAIEFLSNHSNPGAAALVDVPDPRATGHDLLVRVAAIGMNPVDFKVRPQNQQAAKILGFDATGTVVAVGEKVTMFSIGDQVYYAGDVTRPGSNAELQLVDERITAKAPVSLNASESAAIPLTALTAWEALFERLNLSVDQPEKNKERSILIIGGAGGVGSIAIQLAKLAGLRVIATASRHESILWCQQMGADEVINHHGEMPSQIRQCNLDHVDFIANFNQIDGCWDAMGEMIAPQGSIVLITGHEKPLDLSGSFKMKSVKICWEYMFTRSMFQTPDMVRQHEILSRVAKLLDQAQLKTTARQCLRPINVENILEAHRQLESGQTIGKITLSDWKSWPIPETAPAHSTTQGL